MAVQMIRGGQDPRRNATCPCGSGLKYKRCHGDPQKKAIIQQVANEAMTMLILEEKLRKGLIDEDTYNGVHEKLVENATVISSPADPEDSAKKGAEKSTICKDCGVSIPDNEIYCNKCAKVNR